jgi:hypothetical protein
MLIDLATDVVCPMPCDTYGIDTAQICCTAVQVYTRDYCSPEAWMVIDLATNVVCPMHFIRMVAMLLKSAALLCRCTRATTAHRR